MCVHNEFLYKSPGERILSPYLPKLLSNIKGYTFLDIVYIASTVQYLERSSYITSYFGFRFTTYQCVQFDSVLLSSA